MFIRISLYIVCEAPECPKYVAGKLVGAWAGVWSLRFRLKNASDNPEYNEEAHIPREI